MTKSELVDSFSTTFNLSNAEANRMVSWTFDTIAASLKKKEPVAIAGFGIFSARDRKARIGKKPGTNEAIKYPAKTVTHFKASKQLKNL